jgi:hypothetical protein
MIKCIKCNTLYSESAIICLYCKIPLEKKIAYDEKEFTFKLKEFNTEDEAQNFKIGLLTTDVPCVIKKEGDKFFVLINEQSKKDAFRLKPNTELPLSFGAKEIKSNKTTLYVALFFGFVIVCFIIYFSQLGRKMFFKNMDDDIKIITEGGTVDENIAERKGTLSPKTTKKPKPPVEKDKNKEITTPVEDSNKLVAPH